MTHHKPAKRILTLCAFWLAAGVLWACTPGGEGGNSMVSEEVPDPVALGPVDGQDLPATELERVALGMPAPDFSLENLEGDTVTLSSFRGSHDVILVFYRGHW